MTLNCFGQPQYSGMLASDVLGYELLIRQQAGMRWRLPTDLAALSAAQFARLLQQAIESLPTMPSHISFNLDRRQFIDPGFLPAVLAVQATTPAKLTVELTERADPTIHNTQIIAAARRFFAAGIDLCIDDIGCGDNLPGLNEALAPYVSTYKFNLQNFRQRLAMRAVGERFAFWYQQARLHHKQFHIAGIESLDELTNLRQHHVGDVLQGFYFGMPLPLCTA